jgi:cyclopropane fatty-acyl-phospholipid synthase-like methyltransferase
MISEAPWSFVEQYYLDDLAEQDTTESRYAQSWLKDVRGVSILSLGCGPNFFEDVQFFSEVPREIVGVDLNENNIEFLKQSAHPEMLRRRAVLKEHGIGVSLIHGDIRKKREGFQGHFDTVYLSGVLGMFQKTELSELLVLVHSYLKPGGRIVDIDWTDCRLSPEKYAERESFDWYSKKGPDVEEIGKMMTVAGFTVLRHDTYTVTNPEDYGWGTIYGYLSEAR